MERAAIFIDGANVMYQQRHLGWKIDWEKLLHCINEDYRVVSARYYTALKEPPSEDQKSFHRMLATTGFSLKTKQLKKVKDPDTGDIIYKGNLDIELVIDALSTIEQYDIFILFSGDSDFVPLITALHQQRKIVKAFSTKGFSSIDLVFELGMDFRDISDYKSRFELIDKLSSETSKKKVKANQKYPSQEDNQLASTQVLPDIGDKFKGSVLSIKDYGVFLSNEFNAKVLLHIKNMNVGYISKPLEEVFEVGDEFYVTINNIDTTQTVKEISVSLTDNQFQKDLQKRIKE